MTIEEKEQIKTIISTIEETKKIIPTFSDLCDNQIFWNIFQNMNQKQQEEINLLIKEYIEDKIKKIRKTKGGQLFQRFYEWENELFWKFRELNENDETASTPEFQEIWKKVEQEMFRLEWILTERMLKQEKWLDKVVESFYNIVYTFFPRYNSVE